MRSKVRLITFGILAGILLSTLRAPLGLDLLTATAVDGLTAYSFRAAALLALAFAVGSAQILRGGVPILKLIVSMAIGFALHGLWLDSIAPLGTRWEFAIALGGLFVAMHLIARIQPNANASEDAESDVAPPKLSERLGLMLGGVGVVIALETIARPMRQASLGLPADDTAFGIGFLVFIALGIAAFRRYFPIEKQGRIVAAVMLGVAALACVIGANRLNGFANSNSLTTFIHNIGSLVIFTEGTPTIMRMDISHIGTWRADLLVAGACLLIPALLIGIALAGARDSKSLASLLFGAALGTLGFALIVRGGEVPLSFEDLATTTYIADRINIAAFCAGAGVLLVALGTASSVARSAGIFAALCLGAAPSFIAPSDPWLFSPWDQSPIVAPSLTIDTAEGLFTVEPVRNLPTATLNRERLTPAAWEESGDADRIWQSLDLIKDFEGTPRVLFVGQMTPGRSSVFNRNRTLELERTAPWYRHMPAIDKALFADSTDTPIGTIVPVTDARERLNNGDYDLVIVPPNIGRRLPTLPAQFDSAPTAMPRSNGWSVPEGTIAAVWLDTASELGNTDLGEQVLVSTLPFDDPTIAVVLGDLPANNLTVQGASRLGSPTGLSTLRSRGYQRQHRSRSRLFERLAEASKGTDNELWMNALALHYGAQSEVSPFGDWAQGIEFTDAMLSSLREEALNSKVVRSDVRLFWEQIARTLRDVRSPDLILEFVKPVAEAHSPWYELDYAVVAAYMEFDMDEEVSKRLPKLIEADLYDITLMLLCSKWEEDHDRDAAALDYLRQANAVQSGRWDVVRRAAVISHRLQSEDAASWLQQALALDPEDDELLEMSSATQ
ncbi:MAG: hypothetical protein ACI8TQ_004060 [Planctomycetota bacterium]|jgi:hypothetical protein